MRAVTIIALATTLALCASAADPKTLQMHTTPEEVQRNALKAMGQAGKMLSEVTSAMRQPLSLTEKRAEAFKTAAKALLTPSADAGKKFQAEQATTTAPCNQAAYAEAQQVVLGACPNLVALLSGQLSLQEFLPTFCGSECYRTVASLLPQHSACLDASTRSLEGMLRTCATAPQCFSAGFLTETAVIQATCSPAIATVFRLDNLTTTSAEVSSACTSGCLNRMVSFYSSYGVCLADTSSGATSAPIDFTAMGALWNHMCMDQNGEKCSIRLRSLSRMSCEHPFTNRATCELAGTWCAYTPSTSTSSVKCEANFTTARLNELCTPCLEGLATNRALSTLKVSPVVITAMNAAMCSRVNASDPTSGFCQIAIAAPAAAAVYSLRTGNQSAELGAFCADRVLTSCAARSTGAAVTLMQATATDSFKQCMTRAATATSRSNAEFSCIMTLASAQRTAGGVALYANNMCSRNAADLFCLPMTMALTSGTSPASNCLLYAVATGTCISGCSTVFTNFTSTAGCCLPTINRILAALLVGPVRASNTDTVEVNGAPRSFTYPPSGEANFYLSRDGTVLGAIPQACTALNTTELRTNMTAPCPSRLTSPAPYRELKVRLAWTRVQADPVLLAQVSDDLGFDTANALGVPPEAIINRTVSQDNSTTINLRTSGGRRQTATTSAGCKFTFNINAPSDADATAAAKAFDNAVAANTLVTPATAATVDARCQSCLDARASSAAEISGPTAAPLSASSGAASVVTALALLLAVLAVVM